MLLVGKKEFRDEDHLFSELRRIRTSYPCNAYIRFESDHGEFLWHLLMRHPHWPLGFLAGVTGFRTGRFRSRNERGFCLVDRSGSVIPFSHIDCVRGRDPGVKDRHHCVAFRGIEYQLKAFERQAKDSCDECEQELRKVLAGYHAPRTFDKLWSNFCTGEPELPVSVSGKFSSRDHLLNWQTYHQRHAVLRALCIRCFYKSD